jgi:hypothetical protein
MCHVNWISELIILCQNVYYFIFIFFEWIMLLRKGAEGRDHHPLLSLINTVVDYRLRTPTAEFVMLRFWVVPIPLSCCPVKMGLFFFFLPAIIMIVSLLRWCGAAEEVRSVLHSYVTQFTFCRGPS